MKPLKFILAVVAIALAVACSKGITDSPKPTPTPPDPVPPVTSTDSIVTVSFTTGGEVVLSEESLTKSDKSNDLYFFNVYQFDKEQIIAAYSPLYYAYGCFDDLGKVKLKMVKGKYYCFEMMYIPNAKNVCARNYNDDGYDAPFYSKDSLLNVVKYGNSGNRIEDNYIKAKEKENSGYFSSIERYQGTLWNLYVTDTTSSVKINLYRMMTGIKVDVSNFTEGKVILYIQSKTYDSASKSFELTPMQDTTSAYMEKIIQMPYMPNIIDNTQTGIYDEREFRDSVKMGKVFHDKQSVSILRVKYIDMQGKSWYAYNDWFSLKRLTKHVFKIDIQDFNEKEAGFEPDIKDDPSTPMGEEDVTLE